MGDLFGRNLDRCNYLSFFWNSSNFFQSEANETFPYKKYRGEHNIQVGGRGDLPSSTLS